ncbi:L-lactate dehydrogenase (cytochrome) [Actinopolyspora lacussalsi subsp. righensis]|uniref:L-lactate dehydrogenase (Cytochrome) n=1 Tax=Actinopolyspora righensis TaxID=995060 RepID=A0A1I6XYF6_9ACTN|nr:alpha-hydroxy-acid oxidizing protein [Actinopolyspora righensis]SFT43360.1 L-lactate dehydrogenase (cytochrome) [Actinopolyspora righensis]
MAYTGSFQTRIFAEGGSQYPITMEEWERQARNVLPRRYFDYIAGGAGRELTCAANETAFTRRGLVYRVLRDAADADPSCTVLGTAMSLPVMLAPAGVAELTHADAECGAARAAAKAGVVPVLSAMTSAPLEDVAEAAPEGDQWFQFAWPDDEKLARSLVQRAETAGYRAIVVMGDCYQAGWRPRELAAGFSPFRSAQGLGNYLSDRRFQELAGIDGNPRTSDGLAPDAVANVASTWNRVFTKPTFHPDDLELLRSWTNLPLVIKGVCDPAEASWLCEAGADAIVVSNHGGRQLDNGVAALECLPAVSEAVGERIPVLFDSGVRTGTDVLIALALGASAVMIGRPWLFALAVGGQDGVEHLVECLRTEFTAALALTGHRHCSSLSPADLVASFSSDRR